MSASVILTNDLSLSSSLADDLGCGPFFGQHMTHEELDAELLSRVDPSDLKGLSDVCASAWFGYRFVHPMLRVFYFTHEYQAAFIKTARLIGRGRLAKSALMKANPFAEASKAQVTSLVRATFTADAHGIPYDLWLRTMMDEHVRRTVTMPLRPNELFSPWLIDKVIDAWRDRNEAGIYTADAPIFLLENYAGHPIQDAYQHWLCDQVFGKGNKPYYLARLMFDRCHLGREIATARFGAEAVDRAEGYK